MKLLKYLFFGFLFGVVLVKSEAMSWFRIQEMFRFQSFHMFGIFGSAVLVGGITVFLVRKYNLRTVNKEEIVIKPKAFHKIGNVLGGISFGLGWALTGCCVAPLFVLVGYGYPAAAVFLVSALLGVFVYGWIRHQLPH